MQIVAAEGPVLDEILSASFEIWNEGLSRKAYPTYYRGQLKTAWGSRHLHRWALVDGDAVLASAKVYELDATLDGRGIRVFGLGAVFTQPQHRGHHHARALLERLLERAAGEGFDLALLFSEIGADYYVSLGFTAIPTFSQSLRVREDARRGAPATLVRAGDDRDMTDIAGMDAVRAEPYRFHLNRDRDFVQYVMAKRRLLAGLGQAGHQHVQFFVAEEGASAVAYVAITQRGDEWTIDAAGDRDPAGARLGAILQALIAREPSQRRPVIRGSLPTNLRPPQVEVVDEQPTGDVMMIRPLTASGTPTAPLGRDDVLYWRGDLF